METTIILLSALLLILGLLGSFIPILPGIPLSYSGILLLHFATAYSFSVAFLIWWGIIVVVVQLLDFVIPIWGTKKFGGSSKGVWGSGIGLLVGIFFAPLGIIIGPILGAFIGEKMANKEGSVALKAAFGSFIGVMFGTLLKLVVAGFLLFYFIRTVLS